MQNPLPLKEVASALEGISEENEHETSHEEPENGEQKESENGEHKEPENVEPEEKVVVEEKERIVENPVPVSKEDNKTTVEVKKVEMKQDLSGDCCCVY